MFWAYLGPYIVILVVIGIALLYWATRDTRPEERAEATMGTSGKVSPGGLGLDPKPDHTQEEREFGGTALES